MDENGHWIITDPWINRSKCNVNNRVLTSLNHRRNKNENEQTEFLGSESKKCDHRRPQEIFDQSQIW